MMSAEVQQHAAQLGDEPSEARNIQTVPMPWLRTSMLVKVSRASCCSSFSTLRPFTCERRLKMVYAPKPPKPQSRTMKAMPPAPIDASSVVSVSVLVDDDDAEESDEPGGRLLR
jgi:hypothetical protein